MQLGAGMVVAGYPTRDRAVGRCRIAAEDLDRSLDVDALMAAAMVEPDLRGPNRADLADRHRVVGHRRATGFAAEDLGQRRLGSHGRSFVDEQGHLPWRPAHSILVRTGHHHRHAVKLLVAVVTLLNPPRQREIAYTMR